VHQRGAVAEGVAGAQQEGAAVAVAAQEMHLPQRLPLRQRLGHLLLDVAVQRLVVTRLGDAGRHDVVVEAELVDLDPLGRSEAAQREHRLPHDLAEAGVDVDPALLQQGPHLVPVRLRVEPADHVDDHPVGRPVHVQPGRVRPRQLLTHALLPLTIGRGWSPGGAYVPRAPDR
jgi:hypothetical protein